MGEGEPVPVATLSLLECLCTTLTEISPPGLHLR